MTKYSHWWDKYKTAPLVMLESSTYALGRVYPEVEDGDNQYGAK